MLENTIEITRAVVIDEPRTYALTFERPLAARAAYAYLEAAGHRTWEPLRVRDGFVVLTRASADDVRRIVPRGYLIGAVGQYVESASEAA